MSVGAAGNPTVAMVEAAFLHHGLPWRYINMEVAPADLGTAVRGAKAMGFRGFNCSLPHKVSVIEHLDGLGESAAAMGAVNCVVRRGQELIGENTDGKGFGAGGAARAVAVELGLAGARRITVVNRSGGRGAELAGLLRDTLKLEAELVVWSGDYVIPDGTDVVINATSIGLYEPDARLAVDLNSLHPEMVVADVVFNPVTTRFLREAAERGCRAVDGLGMLVNQGVIGVRFWTGIDPDPEVMRMALEKAMGV